MLSCLASVDKKPTQNARRPLSDALEYAGHHSAMSRGTVLTKGVPCAFRAEMALRVQRSVPLRCDQRVLGMWPSLTSGLTPIASPSCAETASEKLSKIIQIVIIFTKISQKCTLYHTLSRRMISPASPPRRQNFGGLIRQDGPSDLRSDAVCSILVISQNLRREVRTKRGRPRKVMTPIKSPSCVGSSPNRLVQREAPG